MSEADLIKILIACNAGLLGMFLHHIVKCRDTRVDIATIKGSISSIAKEIGDHESGIRKRLHDMQNALVRLENRRGDER